MGHQEKLKCRKSTEQNIFYTKNSMSFQSTLDRNLREDYIFGPNLAQKGVKKAKKSFLHFLCVKNQKTRISI